MSKKTYKIKFRIKIDKRTVVDTIVVDAENKKEALKKVRENTLGRPKIVAIHETPPSIVRLSEQETIIVQNVFKNAVKKIVNEIIKIHQPHTSEAEFARNKLIVRLAELLKDEVETNF